jgi:hypothetical protein
MPSSAPLANNRLVSHFHLKKSNSPIVFTLGSGGSLSEKTDVTSASLDSAVLDAALDAVLATLLGAVLALFLEGTVDVWQTSGPSVSEPDMAVAGAALRLGGIPQRCE